MRELVARLINDPYTANKFIVAVIGFVVIAATQGLIPDPYAAWITIIGSGITAGAVYQVPNKPDDDEYNEFMDMEGYNDGRN